MPLLQEDKAIFYHPLDDAAESLESQAWTGAGAFGAAKVSGGLAAATTFGAATEFVSVGTAEDISTANSTRPRSSSCTGTALPASATPGSGPSPGRPSRSAHSRRRSPLVRRHIHARGCRRPRRGQVRRRVPGHRQRLARHG